MKLLLIIFVCTSLFGCFSHPDGLCDECRKHSLMLIIHQTCKKESWEWIKSQDESSSFQKLEDAEKAFQLSIDVERFICDTMPDIAIRRASILKKYKRIKIDYISFTKGICKVSSEDAQNLMRDKAEELYNTCFEVAKSYLCLNKKIEDAYAKYQTTSFILSDRQRDDIISEIEESLNEIEFVTNDIKKAKE